MISLIKKIFKYYERKKLEKNDKTTWGFIYNLGLSSHVNLGLQFAIFNVTLFRKFIQIICKYVIIPLGWPTMIISFMHK